MEDPPPAQSSRTAWGLRGPRVPVVNRFPRSPHKSASSEHPLLHWSPGTSIPAATSTCPPAGGRGALPGAVARLPPAEIRAPSTAGPLRVTAPASQARRLPRLRGPTPWSRPLEGRLANRSPGTQAEAEPEQARVPQKCERVGLNRWMANGSARVRDAWGGGTGPWLESRSQLP